MKDELYIKRNQKIIEQMNNSAKFLPFHNASTNELRKTLSKLDLTKLNEMSLSESELENAIKLFEFNRR